MFQINKRPIVVLSAPRTGSTALTAYIRKMSNDSSIQAFYEPDAVGGRMNEFLQVYNSDSKNFIVKTHLMNIERYSPEIANFFTTSDSVFRIRIQRKDLIKQIVSYYIAVSRGNKWHYRNVNELDIVDNISIDNSMLQNHVKHIIRGNKILKESKINFDLNLFYEDLPEMNNLSFYINPKPVNYQEIFDAVTKIVSESNYNP